MPCGGIYPVKREPKEAKTSGEKLDCTKGGCWWCDRGGAYHQCDEWDTYIHARCVPDFLLSGEGQVLINHGHQVILDFSLEK